MKLRFTTPLLALLATAAAACSLTPLDPRLAGIFGNVAAEADAGATATPSPNATMTSDTDAGTKESWTTPIPAAGKATLRIVHAAPDAPKVDIYAKGVSTPLLTGLQYGDTSGWIELTPGTAEVEVRASPSTSTSPLVYTTGTLTIPDRASITAVAAGLLSSAQSQSSFRVIPVINKYGAQVPGSARVRVLHAGSDAPSVDLDVGNDNPQSPEVRGLARFSDTGQDGVPLPAGKQLAVGIDAGGARVTAFTTPSLPDGAEILLIATGLLGKLPREGNGFALLAVGPNGNLGFIKQDPTLYTLHASPDAPEVDAFVGETKIIDNLKFGALTAPIQVPPGNYTVDVFAHSAGTARPSGSPVLSAQSGNLEAGQRYLTAATGFLAPTPQGYPALRLQAARDDFALGDSGARWRLVHSAPDAPNVDVGVISGNTLSPVVFGNITFGSASAGEGFAAPINTALPIGVAPAGQDTSIVRRFTVTGTAAQRAFIVADGALGSPTRPFRLAIVETNASPWTVTHVFAH